MVTKYYANSCYAEHDGFGDLCYHTNITGVRGSWKSSFKINMDKSRNM